MKKEFIEKPITDANIEPGNGASGTFWTDYTPYEVVRIISCKTIEIRELDYEMTSGSQMDGSAEYKYFSNDERHIERARLGKRGWKLANGMRIYLGHARRYYDPSF